MRRAVAVMLDGLRRDFVRADTMPNLMTLRARSQWFDAHRSAVPSVTRVCASTFATGCRPARHEIEGNTMALVENGRFAVHDVGPPGFFSHKRQVTGRSLAVPTLAERTRERGGAVMFSNVSPGAAYAHDPDGHGVVYHRAGSFGRGGQPVPPERALDVSPELDGDRAMAERFVREALTETRPALAVMWLGHPDTTQHAVPLGSPDHIAALRAADDHLGLVVEAVEQLRATGDDVLFIVGSDHGHQTVHDVIDVQREVAALGFGEAMANGDLVVVPNGTAVLIYVSEAGRALIQGLSEQLSSQPWAGRLVAGSALADIGHTEQRGLALFMSMASDEEPNAFGVPGRSFAAKPLAGKPDRLGCGQHGGLGRYEQSPVLMIDGPGFVPAAVTDEATTLVDIAPTILRHLGLPADGLDGRALQTAGHAAT